MLQKHEKRRITRIGMSKPSDMAYVNAIHQTADAVESIQDYLNSLHDAIKDLEAEVKKLKQDLRH